MAAVTNVSGEYTLPECGFTAPAESEFKAWKVGNQEKQPGDKIYVSADTTIQAVWLSSKMTITFDANGGTGEMAAAKVAPGT
jgi:pyocin large subunit-like protein